VLGTQLPLPASLRSHNDNNGVAINASGTELISSQTGK